MSLQILARPALTTSPRCIDMQALENPFAYMKAAALGDLSALRALAEHSLAMLAIPTIDPVRTLHEGLIFARLAAAAGDIGDRSRVFGMLALAGELSEPTNPNAASDHAAEAIGLASLIAEDDPERGGEIAANGLNLLAELVTPEILERAKEYAAAMKEAY